MGRGDSSFWDVVCQPIVCNSFYSILPRFPGELCWVSISSTDLTREGCLMTGASSGNMPPMPAHTSCFDPHCEPSALPQPGFAGN